MIIILGTTLIKGGLQTLRSAFSLFSYFWFGFLGFLVFVVGLLYPIEKKYSYQLFLTAGILIITLIINIIPSLGRGLLLSLGILSGYYILTYFVKQRNIPHQESSTLSVRRILAGERIKKRQTIPHRKVQLHQRITSSPQWFQRLLELPNLVLLVVMIICYLYFVVQETTAITDLRYRTSLVIFLFNVYVLKKIQYISNVSRFALALVVNFAVYSAVLKS